MPAPLDSAPGGGGGGQPTRARRGPDTRSRNVTSTPREPREGFTAVGRVLRPHALRGEIRALAFSPSAMNLQRGRTVFLGGVRRTVLRARPDREAWIIQLSGVTDRAEVEALRGELLEAPDAEVLRDDDESYFVHELMGLRVVTTDGLELGTIGDVITTGANDVYVVNGPGGEVLVPVISDVIEEIDIAGGLVCITPLAGMLDESQ